MRWGDRVRRGLVGRVRADRVLEIVDPNMVFDHVDVSDLLDRVDVNRRPDLDLAVAAVQTG